MKSQLPAKRYDLFITAFEKEVTKAQESIKKMDLLMKPYEICREVLELFDYDNPTKLRLHSMGVGINLDVLDNDQKEKFDKLIAKLGSKLIEHKLRDDEHPPAEQNNGWSIQYNWRLKGFKGFQYPPTISLSLDAPYEGTQYLKVETIKRLVTIKESDRKLLWLSTPQIKETPKDEIEF